MILALDIGNTQVQGGVFDGDELILQFRKTSTSTFSSDEFGLFLRSALRENDFDPEKITAISFCSVVPTVMYSVKSACVKYFDLTPFILEPGVRTGLRIKYKNPAEVGTDRIANAIAATNMYPDRGLVIIDLGTATTFCVLSQKKDYLGGTIIPGIKVSMNSLEEKAAKLQSVEIVRPASALGQTTVGSLQSGLFYSHLGAMKEILGHLKEECFPQEEPLIIGTGGLSQLFDQENIFDKRHPDLALQGLKLAYVLNQ